MHKFKDKTGHEWEIELTIASARRAKNAGVDLLGEKIGTLVSQFSQDAELLVTTLYALLEPQINEQKLSPEQFADRFIGDTIVAAADALVAEVCLFTPNATLRKTLQEIASRTKAVVEKAAQTALARATSGEMEKAVEAKLATLSASLPASANEPTSGLKISGALSSNSPG